MQFNIKFTQSCTNNDNNDDKALWISFWSRNLPIWEERNWYGSSNYGPNFLWFSSSYYHSILGFFQIFFSIWFCSSPLLSKGYHIYSLLLVYTFFAFHGFFSCLRKSILFIFFLHLLSTVGPVLKQAQSIITLTSLWPKPFLFLIGQLYLRVFTFYFKG